MMKRFNQFFGAGLLAVCSMGCQPVANVQPQPIHKSVVVDLDAVAKALHWDSLIAGKVEEATRNLNAQLLKAAENMENELKQQQASLGANPTPEQITNFKQSQARVQQNIQNNKRIAEQAREAVRAEQISLFRKRVKPIAGGVAKSHDADMVLIANADVVWFEAAVDVTGDIIAAMRAQALKAEDSAATVTAKVTASTPAESNSGTPDASHETQGAEAAAPVQATDP